MQHQLAYLYLLKLRFLDGTKKSNPTRFQNVSEKGIKTTKA